MISRPLEVEFTNSSFGANIARGTVDEYGLPGGHLAILEEHLRSRDSYNRGRGRFDEIQALWF